jgi:phosphatidylinositol glycan class B
VGKLKRTMLNNAGFYDKDWIKFVRPWIIICGLILLVTAVFSFGYYHGDEHFQTIEFANFKLGNSHGLAWEYNAQMRPWLQPAIYYVVCKAFYAINITDPFFLAMIFRFISTAFAFLMIVALFGLAYHHFRDISAKKYAVYVLSLLAFLPFMFVRTSSESLSSSFSMIGFALLILGSTPLPNEETDDIIYHRNYSLPLLFIVGVMWGISFEFRYQVAFLIAGFVFWLFFISIRDKKQGAKSLAVLLCGIFIPIILCTLLDLWGYGTFTIAPWNYLYQNIFLHKASGFGTMPFYGYIQLMFENKTSFFMFIILPGCILGMLRYPKNPFSWGIAVFFLAHSLVAHKELRFLMNILIPAIFSTINGLRIKNTRNILQVKIWKFRKSIFAKVFYGFNIFMLFIYLTILNGDVTGFEKQLYAFIKPSSTVYILNDSPYGKNGIQHDFYKPKDVSFISVESLDFIDTSNEVLVISSNEYTNVLNDFTSTEILHYKPKGIYLIIHDYIKNDERKSWGLYSVKAKRNEAVE